MLSAASALLLSSCAKEKTVGIAEGELVEYTLQAEVGVTGAGLDIDTKVALNADGVTPNWETGDEILVLDADKKPVGTDGIFTLSSGAGTASGKFTGTVYVGQKATYAIYPASAGTVSGTSPVTAGTLAAPTGNNAGSIKGAVMLGTSSDGTTMAFTNACAVLTFNTGDYGKSGGDPAIKSVKVSASYGSTATPIAGAFTIDWTATTPSIAPAGSGTVNELTVTLPSALQANDKNVYIPIFPLSMQSSTAPSMKYEFTNTDEGTAQIAYDFTAAIAANTMKNLGTAQGMEFKTPGPDPNLWVDLGMLSSNGLPLLVSRYNVKSVSPEGVVTFADEDNPEGEEIAIASLPKTFTDGKIPCRIMQFTDYYGSPAKFRVCRSI